MVNTCNGDSGIEKVNECYGEFNERENIFFMFVGYCFEFRNVW